MSDTTGFAMVPNHLVRDPRFSRHAMLVFLVIASHYPQAWPSHKTIAEESGISVASVKRALDVLKEAKLVTWQPRSPGGTNRYKLELEFLDENEGVAQGELGGSLRVSYEEETIQEDKNQEPPPSPSTLTDWQPSANDLAWAAARCVTVDVVVATGHWREFHLAHGTVPKSPSALWRAWMAQQAVGPTPAPLHGSASRTASAMGITAAGQAALFKSFMVKPC